jgi:hypothetical protein
MTSPARRILTAWRQPIWKKHAQSWGLSSVISALADRNISAGAKNRRAGQMSQPGKENYENTNYDNEADRGGSYRYRNAAEQLQSKPQL